MSNQNLLWNKYDLLMAISCFILGNLYIRLVFFSQEGWGVSLFTGLFAGAVFAYVRFKNLKPSNESWFWSGVLLVIAASFALWQAANLSALRWLLLHFAAIYWVLILTRATKNGATSDWLPIDVLKGMLTQPFSRLHIQYACLNSYLKGRVYLRSKVLFGILGVFIAAIFILIAWPLLIGADTGGFQDLLRGLNLYPLQFLHINEIAVIRIILTLLTATYMFALLTKEMFKPTDAQMKDKASLLLEKLKVMPGTTAYTALIILNGFYAVFLVTQAPYYVSAFQGLIPEGWESYAEFARRGFFELIAISFLNLLFIAFSHLFTIGSGKNAKPFKLLISILSLSSIFLTATATARLVLYVNRFGLTFMRVLPAVFMVFLTVLFVGIIIKQFKNLSVMRLAAFSGAVIICLLFIVNLDGVIAEYNAHRFLKGTLEEFDTNILWEARVAGIPAAIRVFKETNEPHLRSEIRNFLQEAKRWMLHETKYTIRDTLQHKLARRMLEEHRELLKLPAD